MKVEDIILDYIRHSLTAGQLFRNWEFETSVQRYAQTKYQIMHTAGTYSRIFRKMRVQNVFAKNGYTIQDVTSKHKGAKTKIWEIQHISKSPMASTGATTSSLMPTFQ